MPLGTFAVSTNQKNVQPSQVVQLAARREGTISGTLYHGDPSEAQTSQGQVDNKTQRVAFRIGEGEQVVAETGLFNRTQEQAAVRVHFGRERRENYCSSAGSNRKRSPKWTIDELRQAIIRAHRPMLIA